MAMHQPVEKGKSGCNARTIQEDVLQQAVVTAVNEAYRGRESIIPMLKENIEAVFNNDYSEQLKKLDQELKEKQVALLETEISIDEQERLGEEIIAVREDKQSLLTESALKQETQNRIQEMMDYLVEQVEEVEEYSEALVRRLIEGITIHDKKVIVEFKSGIEIEVEV